MPSSEPMSFAKKSRQTLPRTRHLRARTPLLLAAWPTSNPLRHRPKAPPTKLRPVALNPTLSGQFEAESTNPAAIGAKKSLTVAILPAGWAGGQCLGLEHTPRHRTRQHVGGDGAELGQLVDCVFERPPAGRGGEYRIAVERR